MKIDPYVLEAIKGMDLPGLMQRHGLVLKPAGRNSYQARCPFHDDKTPSLSVGFKNDKWMWNCFGCPPDAKSRGNYLDFRMAFEKLSFTEAYEKCVTDLGRVPSSVNGGSIPPGNGEPPPSRPANAPELMRQAVAFYHQTFLEDRRGPEYLAGRGIKDPEFIKRFQIGFVSGGLRRILPEDPGHEHVVGLKAVGILNERGNESFYNRVVFPITDENGGILDLYGRSVAEGSAPHLYMARAEGGRRGVWNGQAFKAHQEIILTEKILDAASLYVLGFANAVPIYGVNGLTEDHLRLMKEHRTRRVFLCLDNDSAGRAARPGVRRRLEDAGVEVLDLIFPSDYKDVNEALMKGMKAAEFDSYLRLTAAVAKAPLSCEEVPSLEVGPMKGAADTPPGHRVNVPAVEQKEDGVYFRFAGRVYRASGVAAKPHEQLRVHLRVEAAEGGNHRDTFDLYSARGRDAFVSCCRKIFPSDAGELHQELNRIIEALEKLQAEGLLGAKEPEERKMSAEEEAQALGALKSPTLYADILRDMEAVGYVGEEHNKAIGYLVGISRKLEDPLSCSIISQSAAGKSVLADTVEKMTPPEDVLSLSRATPQAFFYIVKDGIKHKLVLMEERVGAEQSDYAIRSLQSKKKLSQLVTLKDESTGEMKSKFFEVEGPVSYIETTTQPRIHEENATRSFLIFLDESPEQTRRIHERQRLSKTLDGLRKKTGQDDVLRRHHNMQRLLKNVAVVIPYAHLLDFPTTWLRTRRDNLRFLNLIVVITFLHQHQRAVKRTEEEVPYIEASLADYDIAHALARAVMGESFNDLKRPQRELLKAVERFGVVEGGVTRRQIREATGLADTRLRDLLNDLVSLEYLREGAGGGQGRTSRYVLTDRAGELDRPLAGLTSPEELRRKLQ